MHSIIFLTSHRLFWNKVVCHQYGDRKGRYRNETLFFFYGIPLLVGLASLLSDVPDMGWAIGFYSSIVLLPLFFFLLMNAEGRRFEKKTYMLNRPPFEEKRELLAVQQVGSSAQGVSTALCLMMASVVFGLFPGSMTMFVMTVLFAHIHCLTGYSLYIIRSWAMDNR